MNFTALMDYRMMGCMDAERMVYENHGKVQLMILEIQGKLKTYEILSQNRPTAMRLNVYSILLKDPEGFNDDEGALVYIRYEAS